MHTYGRLKQWGWRVQGQLGPHSRTLFQKQVTTVETSAVVLSKLVLEKSIFFLQNLTTIQVRSLSILVFILMIKLYWEITTRIRQGDFEILWPEKKPYTVHTWSPWAGSHMLHLVSWVRTVRKATPEWWMCPAGRPQQPFSLGWESLQSEWKNFKPRPLCLD